MLTHGPKVGREIESQNFSRYCFSLDRLWRKTRSKTIIPLCYGADPNRNWDYEWDHGTLQLLLC